MNKQQLKKVTRFEVIDNDGRSYTKHNIKNVELSLQDDGRTLKVFIKSKECDHDLFADEFGVWCSKCGKQ